MDTIFINSKNSGTSDPRRLLLNLADKIVLKKNDKSVVSSNLNIYYTWKNNKSHTKIINLKYQLQHEMKNLNYLMGYILIRYLRLFSIYLKKTWIIDW